MATASTPVGVSFTFGYNEFGQRTSVADSQGLEELSTYDEEGQLVGRLLKRDGVNVLEITQEFASGRLLGQVRINYLDGEPVETVHVSYGYDEVGRLTEIAYTDANGEPIDSFQYNWGEAISHVGYGVAQLLAAADSRGNDYTYSYDEYGQLTGDGSQTWSYDANGNRIDDDTVIGLANQLLEDANWEYAYDAEGNLTDKVSKTKDLRWHYGYDHVNRLVLAEKYTGASGSETLDLQAAYKYDGVRPPIHVVRVAGLLGG